MSMCVPIIKVLITRLFVQGEGVADSIVKGIQTLDAMNLDVIIVGFIVSFKLGWFYSRVASFSVVIISLLSPFNWLNCFSMSSKSFSPPGPTHSQHGVPSSAFAAILFSIG